MIPTISVRARRLAALMALAHEAGVTIPTCSVSIDGREPRYLWDVSFTTDDPEVYAEWLTWLAGDNRTFEADAFVTQHFVKTVNVDRLDQITIGVFLTATKEAVA